MPLNRPSEHTYVCKAWEGVSNWISSLLGFMIAKCTVYVEDNLGKVFNEWAILSPLSPAPQIHATSLLDDLFSCRFQPNMDGIKLTLRCLLPLLLRCFHTNQSNTCQPKIISYFSCRECRDSSYMCPHSEHNDCAWFGLMARRQRTG